MLWKDNQLFCNVPLPKADDRPLIVSHPGAHMNYLASWNVMVDHGEPFVLVCDDLGPAFPDGWWAQHSKDGMEYFARLQNPQGVGQAYRNPDLTFQNLLVHREMEANKGMGDFPLIDIMYVDFIEIFLKYNGEVDWRPTFMAAAPKMVEKVRDGGVLIIDRKNVHEDYDQWLEFPQGEFEVSPGITLEHVGKGEWLILDIPLNGGGRDEIHAEVFRVSNSNPLGNPDDFLATLMKERRLAPEDLEELKGTLPARWPEHPSNEEYYERLFNHYDHPNLYERPNYPEPLMSSWKIEQYNEWLQWLIDHPDKLRPVERNERIMQMGNTKVRLVHGDILKHLDWLTLKKASLAVRRNLQDLCIDENHFLAKNAVKLQPLWIRKPIADLIWSGPDATPNLTSELLRLSKSSMLATVSHSLATLDELKAALKDYDGHVGELVIFHLDEGDYR